MEYVPWLSLDSIIWEWLSPFRTRWWCLCKYSYLENSVGFLYIKSEFTTCTYKLYPSCFWDMLISLDLIIGIFDMSNCHETTPLRFLGVHLSRWEGLLGTNLIISEVLRRGLKDPWSWGNVLIWESFTCLRSWECESFYFPH